MAKKKRIVINDQELTPTVLATIKERKFGFVGLILLFAVFGSVVFYLPEISKYVDAYLNPVENIPTINNGKDDEDNEQEIVITEYPYSSSLEIKEKNIFTFNTFNIVDNKLTFNVVNPNSVALKFDSYHYFLEIFNEKDTLLQRIQLKDIVVGASANTSVSYDLTDINVSYFTLVEIKEEDYPAYIVKTDENKKGTLVCTKGNEIVNYLLDDNKLYAIEDVFNVNNTDVNYATLWSTYQALSSTYNTINGVTSEVTVNDTSLVFKTHIDLNTNDNAGISDIIYKKNTDAKIMRFELMSNGYSCK